MEELDLKDVETAVDQLLEEKQSMRGMIREILTSGQAFSAEQWKAVIQQGVWDAMGIQKETCVHILVLVLLSAVFYHLSGVFQNNQIGDISFYMIYLLLIFTAFCRHLIRWRGRWKACLRVWRYL